MILTVLKSEDIVFMADNGEKFVNLQSIDLNKIARIEGVSEYSVLQLEYNGKSYLLTEEFSIESTLEVLEEFLEEYDEEDEDTEEENFDIEEEFENIINDEELEEEPDNEFNKEIIKNDEEYQNLEQEEKNQAQFQESEELNRGHFNTSHLLYKAHVLSTTDDVVELVNSSSVSSNTVTEAILSEHSETEELIQTIEEIPLIEDSSSTNTGTSSLPLVQAQTLLESNIAQNKLEEALLRMEKASLVEGDFLFLEVTGLNENEDSLAQINNVLSDTTLDEGRDTIQLQNIADVLIKLGESNLTQNEFQILGLDNLSIEDVVDLNMAINDTDSLALGITPTTNLQLILDSLNLLDEGKDVSLTNLSNIGVTGVGGVNQPTLATLNIELNGEDNTNDVQALVTRLQSKEDALIRLEEEALIEGDLGLLGIINIEDGANSISQINNILSDTTIDEGRDTIQLQNIADVLIKLGESDLTQNEFQILGLDNLSIEDVVDLNMAIKDTDSLALGIAPTTNLQLILDSLNLLDEGKDVSLTNLSNIGVTGVGGVNQPTLATLNIELNGEDNTNDVQALVTRLQSKEDALIRLEEEALIEGDLGLLGIINITDNANTISQINNVLSDTTLNEGRDTIQLQNIADVLIKLGESDLTQNEFQILGLDNLSIEDVVDLNMAINDTDSLALGITPTTNLQLILDSLNLLDEGKDVSLTDLSNIGVIGIGGEGEPTLEELNLLLNGEDNTNDVQALVDVLQARNDLNIRLESETLVAGDLTSLGITGLEDNTDNIVRINNILEDDGVSIGGDITQLQVLVDILIKIDAKDGDSFAPDITQAEWELIGLDNVSSPDANELNIALESPNSLDLGTTPQSNLQRIEDSLNALDEVKYGNSTGVTLLDLTNIGVVGVNEGGDEPTLESVNMVLYDEDVFADNTDSVQNVVDALLVLNESDGDATIEISAFGLESLGITSSYGFSEDELDYINNRISENDPANNIGDGDYTNDVVELQDLVDFIGDKNIYIGTVGDDDIYYNNLELDDGQGGFDILLVDAGMNVDLSEIENIEEIVLNQNDGNLDTTLGTVLDEINSADVIDMTDENNFLFITSNGSTSIDSIYLDSSEFGFDSFSGGYNYFTAIGGTVTLAIDENIIIE